jgi:hypothetical protein
MGTRPGVPDGPIPAVVEMMFIPASAKRIHYLVEGLKHAVGWL